MIPLPEHPRPQMVRERFHVLNGMWRYAITSAAEFPAAYDGEILVPYSPESALSGVGRVVRPEDHLWYAREVTLPAGYDERVLLHFGAVDFACDVYLDEHLLGSHTGGYLPFAYDVTGLLTGTHTLRVHVTDPSDTSWQARGKQVLDPGGIWYTPQSGIWQTVWLEPVPETYVRWVTIRQSFDTIDVEVEISAAAEVRLEVAAVGEAAGYGDRVRLRVPVSEPHRWSPEDPYLYDLVVTAGSDRVTSYAGLRTVGLGHDRTGRPLLTLNGQPYFQAGVLDQGYWPDGLLTPPSDAAMIDDITRMRGAGFTMLRKHIEIAPLRWYHHCDRLGMLVWQDIVNGGRQPNPAVVSLPAFVPMTLPDSWHRVFGRQDATGRDAYRRDLDATIGLLRNSPAVVAWVPFNEGWGQFDARAAVARVRHLDPSRLVDHASGWHDQGDGDICSPHIYFRPVRGSASWAGERRPVVVSEYGGYSLAMPGHEGPEFGYRRFATQAELTEAYVRLHRDEIVPAIACGLAGTVYTQLSDVEDEVNGLLSADRRVTKIDPAVLRAVNEELRAAFAARVAVGAGVPARVPVADRLRDIVRMVRDLVALLRPAA